VKEPSSHLAELLAAIARRDAHPEDLAAALRKQGADALDLIAELVARAAQPAPDPAAAQDWIDASRFGRPVEPQAASEIVHRVLKVPFLLNGTLYDPQDIVRFNGRELHLVLPKDGPLLVIDERPLIARWWELSYLTSVAAAAKQAERYRYGGHQTVTPEELPPLPASPPPAEYSPKELIPVKPPGTYFYEHAHFGGDILGLPPNREYRDLAEVGRGFLGLGDWNNIISSVRMYDTYVCVLHGHCADQYGGGPTLTLFSNGIYRGFPSLEPLGWNDRASWVETW
jgi:hypothetical protein